MSSSYFYADQYFFDIAQDPPTLAGTLPEAITPVDADATRVLGTSQQNGLDNGLRVIDVSVPSQAQTIGTLFDYSQGPTGALSGNYVYSAEGIGGFAVYHITASGGPRFKAQLGSQAPGAFFALAQVANGTTVFAAGITPITGLGSVNIYDLQQKTPPPD